MGEPMPEIGMRMRVLGAITVKELVDEAVRLKRDIEEKERRLSKIKGLLRQQAEKQREVSPEGEDVKTIDFPGGLGEVQVTFSDPVREIDQSKAREIINLFGETFDNYFSLRVEYRDRDSLKNLLADNPNLADKFNSLTIERESKPRVVIIRT